jgi:uncharacterized membrane protein
VILARPIHMIAIIVWLGGLFLLTVVLGPTIRDMAPTARASIWYRVLSRFFVWGSIALAAIVASGIAVVRLRFGGLSGVPAIHQWNMIVGIPAIGLYVYAQLIPWRTCRRATAVDDWILAEKSISRIRTLFGIALTMALVAAVVSSVARLG